MRLAQFGRHRSSIYEHIRAHLAAVGLEEGGEQLPDEDALAAWPESALYSEQERAALALCEAMTSISDDHVPDDVWERARAAFTTAELAQLVFAIAPINTWNRLLITARVEPGHYEPGLFEAA